ncbi:putative concanavalin a-like lectins glucanase [Golovinomyces cichoracearum]|uniref:Putative concanavalin a-like lectins glucanase n=1 Tax=Golovinomyces cichoracearum TaxID=62708 RepID=A0A420HT45_9PEZI|nr:putative concanavalin a-like lectins glucanase [Golovinomyces cichoracearum]
MDLSDSFAKWAATLSFLTNLAAQIYGLTTSPNMKDINDANLSFWSPQPIYIALLFFPLQLFQIVWLYLLFWRNAAPVVQRNVVRQEEIKMLVEYVPYYSLGNFSIAIWMIFWNLSQLKIANIFVLINSSIQLYYIYRLIPHMNKDSASSILTHIISKSLAGIGVIDLLHNSSAAYFRHQTPGVLVRIVTGVCFGALASSSDWIFGSCLVYDLIALSVGQRGMGETSWSNLLTIYAIATAGIVILKNLTSPPYKSYYPNTYEPVRNDEAAT